MKLWSMACLKFIEQAVKLETQAGIDTVMKQNFFLWAT